MVSFRPCEDHRADAGRLVPPQATNSDKVRQYNQVLGRIKEQLQLARRSQWRPGDLEKLLEKARHFERSVGHEERRVFAFQDEILPDIGEWSTDRRRQLRNQVFLLKLGQGTLAEVPQVDHRIYLVACFLLTAVASMLLSFWAMTHLHDRDGRGWIMELSSLLGFMCLGGACLVSLPTLRRYFEKPKSGANRYQTVPSA